MAYMPTELRTRHFVDAAIKSAHGRECGPWDVTEMLDNENGQKVAERSISLHPGTPARLTVELRIELHGKWYVLVDDELQEERPSPEPYRKVLKTSRHYEEVLDALREIDWNAPAYVMPDYGPHDP